MLADLLEEVVNESKLKCAVARWLTKQDRRINDVFDAAVRSGLPNYQKFYDLIKDDILAKGEEIPFGISTFKNHIQSRCACVKTRK